MAAVAGSGGLPCGFLALQHSLTSLARASSELHVDETDKLQNDVKIANLAYEHEIGVSRIEPTMEILHVVGAAYPRKEVLLERTLEKIQIVAQRCGKLAQEIESAGEETVKVCLEMVDILCNVKLSPKIRTALALGKWEDLVEHKAHARMQANILKQLSRLLQEIAQRKSPANALQRRSITIQGLWINLPTRNISPALIQITLSALADAVGSLSGYYSCQKHLDNLAKDRRDFELKESRGLCKINRAILRFLTEAKPPIDRAPIDKWVKMDTLKGTQSALLEVMKSPAADKALIIEFQDLLRSEAERANNLLQHVGRTQIRAFEILGKSARASGDPVGLYFYKIGEILRAALRLYYLKLPEMYGLKSAAAELQENAQTIRGALFEDSPLEVEASRLVRINEADLSGFIREAALALEETIRDYEKIGK